jgi:Ca-activated chloride channel homolog
MFRIANPEYLNLLVLIPVFVLLFILLLRWKKRAMLKFGDINVIGRLFLNVSASKPYLKFILLMIAFSSLVIALARPQIGSKLEEVKREGVDVMIALDVSNSMNAEDIRPSRLERSKQAIYRLIDKLQGDRIGLVVFAGQAYVQLPITTDYGAAKLFLATINSSMIPTQGTAIGSAIEKCVASIGDSARNNSAIIVITDGENHEDDAVDAAKDAAEKGITVHTIGMGSVEGAPIPVHRNGIKTGYLQDENQTTVITKLDQLMLQQVADAGKGKFVRATNSDDGIGVIISELNNMQKKEFASKLFTAYEDQFQYFLAVTLLFLFFEFLLSERKSGWIESLNLFGEKDKKKKVIN